MLKPIEIPIHEGIKKELKKIWPSDAFSIETGFIDVKIDEEEIAIEMTLDIKVLTLNVEG